MSSLPSGWVAKESKSHGGRTYYFNAKTGESVVSGRSARPAMV
jgi:hypothetical protein